MEKIDEYEINVADLSDVSAINYLGKLSYEVEVHYDGSTGEVELRNGEGQLLDERHLEEYRGVSGIGELSERHVIEALEPGNGVTITGP